jgi:hypothetical protein
VDDCISNAGDPELPFGGVKHGVGTRHGGVDGIRAFTRPCALRVDARRRRREAAWLPCRLAPARLSERAPGRIRGRFLSVMFLSVRKASC